MDVCPPKTVDRLVIVSNDTDILFFTSQKTHQFILATVGILILIYKDMLKLFLIVFKHIWIVPKKFYCKVEQIVKI